MIEGDEQREALLRVKHELEEAQEALAKLERRMLEKEPEVDERMPPLPGRAERLRVKQLDGSIRDFVAVDTLGVAVERAAAAERQRDEALERERELREGWAEMVQRRSNAMAESRRLRHELEKALMETANFRDLVREEVDPGVDEDLGAAVRRLRDRLAEAEGKAKLYEVEASSQRPTLEAQQALIAELKGHKAGVEAGAPAVRQELEEAKAEAEREARGRERNREWAERAEAKLEMVTAQRDSYARMIGSAVDAMAGVARTIGEQAEVEVNAADREFLKREADRLRVRVDGNAWVDFREVAKRWNLYVEEDAARQAREARSDG